MLLNLSLDSVLMARVPGMDWGLYRVVTTSHAPLLCSGTLAILRPLPAHQTPAHSALSRSQTTTNFVKSRGFSKLHVCFFRIQSWFFCDSDIAHRACYEHSVHFVAQCAALSNYPGSSLVTSPGARLSLASLARPGAGGEYTNVQPGILWTCRV